VGWGIVIACFAFLLGAHWSGRVRDGVLLGIIVPAQPMIAHLSAVVNNDAAMVACAAGAFAALAMLARDGPDRRAFVLFAGSTLAGALSKPVFAFVLPVLGIGLVLALGPRRLGSWLRAAAALAPSALALLVWSLYSRVGDKLPPAPGGEPYFAILSRTLTPERFYVIWHKTFWMCWGWLDTWIGDDYYSALALAVVLAALGLVLGWRRLDPRQRAMLWLAAGGTVFMLAAMQGLELMVVRRTGNPLIQGRYLLPLFPLQAVALVTGLRELSRQVRAWTDGAWSFAALLLVIDGAAVARALVRYYA
jgi:4-amino-4-deoxy-L-arabinose transferase-like glycosyltransferase